MKYLKRSNAYQNSTGTNYIKLDDETGRIDYAESYDWYKYIKTFTHPVTGHKWTVLNRSNYSATTVKHIYQAIRLHFVSMSDFDLILDDVNVSLGEIANVIQVLERQAKSLEAQTKEPRTHKAKNQERLNKANRLINQAMILKELNRGI